MPVIKPLVWQRGPSALGHRGWLADLSKTEELRIIRRAHLQHQLLYVTRRAPDQLLGEFTSAWHAMDFAKIWIGDSES